MARLQRDALINVNTLVSLEFVALIAFAFVRARQIDATAATLVIEALIDIYGEIVHQLYSIGDHSSSNTFTTAISKLVARVANALIGSWQVDAYAVARVVLAFVYV